MWGDPRKMASLAVTPIDGGRMRSNAIVPDYDGLWYPFDSDLEVLAQRDMVVQEVQEVVTLFLLIPDDMASELAVDEQRFLASGWMPPDKWMDGRHWFSSHDPTMGLAIVCLLIG